MIHHLIYNVTNLIVERCKEVEELASKPIIKDLGSEFALSNNIDRMDMFCTPDKMPITTTQGMIYARKIELVV